MSQYSKDGEGRVLHDLFLRAFFLRACAGRMFRMSLRHKQIFSAGLVLWFVVAHTAQADTNGLDTVRVSSAFGRGCEAAIRREVASAKSEIKVAIYCITRRSIAGSLVDAAKRGVKVSVKYDAKQAGDISDMAALVRQMKAAGIVCQAIRMKGENAIMHHKFLIIDGARVLTGSYNFTNTATEQNRENLVVVDSAELARSYLVEFERLKSSR